MTFHSRSEIIEALSSGRAEDILGIAENAWLDFKRAPYALDSDKGKFELCKDVAAFANAQGGLLVCGVAAEKQRDQAVEIAVKLHPFPQDRVDIGKYYDLLNEFLRPCVTINHHWYRDSSRSTGEVSAFYLVIEVESAPDSERYVIVRRALNDRQVFADGLTIPVRHGDRTIYLPAEDARQLISEGLRVRAAAHAPTSSPSDHDLIDGHVLLPAGIDGLFTPITDIKNDCHEFKLDAGALVFLVSELVSHGAVGVATDSSSHLASGRTDLPPTLQRLTRVLDWEKQQLEQLNLIFRPIATDLGLDPEHIDVISDPIVGPQRHVLDLPDTHKKLWSDLLLAHSVTYHLLIGIGSRVQVDVPLREYRAAVNRLRRKTKDSTSTTTLGFLAALAKSYQSCLVGAATPMVSALDGRWITSFQEYIKEAAFREYSEIRSNLGYCARLEQSIERTWAAAQRLLKSTSSRGMLKFTVRTVGVSKGLPPRPPGVIADYFERTHYLPPIVRTSSSLAQARNRWLCQNDTYRGVFDFTFEHFDWLPSVRVPTLVNGVVHVDRDWFLGLFTTTPPADLTQSRWQQLFEHYFAINLESEYVCPQHDVAIGYDDVDVAWEGKQIEISMTSCCEDGMEKAFVMMCAFRQEKKAAYASIHR